LRRLQKTLQNYEMGEERHLMKSKIQKMKRELPYGKYIFEDGSQILFNRDYEPIIQIDTENTELKNDKKQRVFNEKIANAKKLWFYNDTNPPWINKVTLRKCIDILKVFDAK
jgi:hypothetical protein